MLSNRFKDDKIPLLDLTEVQLEAKSKVESKINSDHYKFETVICPICKNKHVDNEVIAEKDRYGLTYNTVICKSCGLLYANPRMTQEAYNEFYNEEYRSLYTAKEVSTLNFFEDQVYHGTQIIDFIKTNLQLKNIEGKHVLEVGCGAGGILKAFRDEGCIVTGLDLGENYLNYGIENWNLSLHNKSIHDFNFENKLDIIVYSHVFEHILDLEKELLKIKSISHKDTLIYIEVPGVLNIHQQYSYNGDFLLYLQNAHTYNFSLELLERLFNQYGFILVVGNEYVKSVFVKGENTNKKESNLYETIMSYLRKLENRIKYPLFYKVMSYIKFRLKKYLIDKKLCKIINLK